MISTQHQADVNVFGAGVQIVSQHDIAVFNVCVVVNTTRQCVVSSTTSDSVYGTSGSAGLANNRVAVSKCACDRVDQQGRRSEANNFSSFRQITSASSGNCDSSHCTTSEGCRGGRTSTRTSDCYLGCCAIERTTSSNRDTRDRTCDRIDGCRGGCAGTRDCESDGSTGVASAA